MEQGDDASKPVSLLLSWVAVISPSSVSLDRWSLVANWTLIPYLQEFASSSSSMAGSLAFRSKAGIGVQLGSTVMYRAKRWYAGPKWGGNICCSHPPSFGAPKDAQDGRRSNEVVESS